MANMRITPTGATAMVQPSAVTQVTGGKLFQVSGVNRTKLNINTACENANIGILIVAYILLNYIANII